MSRADPPRVKGERRPPDLRTQALLVSGLRRGALLVFLPVAVAGQVIGWLEYAISGLFHPWSWAKIGLAYALAGVRVPFAAEVRGMPGVTRTTGPAALELAVGALAVAVIVLAFRAGREQGAGLERRPEAASAAGAVIGLGFAAPMFASALLVRLRFPSLGIRELRPELWHALLLPLVVGCGVGAMGGLAAARGALEGRPWTTRITGAVRGGFTAFWLGLAFAFLGFLVLAAVENQATVAYGRFVGGAGKGGAVLVVHHALVLPNQSAMILATTMGSPTHLAIAEESQVDLTIRRLAPANAGGGSLLRLLHPSRPGREAVPFPTWFWLLLLVPAAATVLGGRRSAAGAKRRREALLRGTLGGAVYAVLCGSAAWAATIVLPIGPVVIPGPIRVGPDPWTTLVVALPWGILGGALGALRPEPVPPPTDSAPAPPR